MPSPHQPSGTLGQSFFPASARAGVEMRAAAAAAPAMRSLRFMLLSPSRRCRFRRFFFCQKALRQHLSRCEPPRGRSAAFRQYSEIPGLASRRAQFCENSARLMIRPRASPRGSAAPRNSFGVKKKK